MAEANDEEPAQRSSVVRLAPLRDIVVHPARAYGEILVNPGWLPAFVFVLLCALFDLWVSTPAILHVALTAKAHHGSVRSAANLTAARNNFLANSALFQVLQPLVAWSLTAMVASTVARFKRTTVPYRTFFALAAVCSVPGALGALLDGAVVGLHPAASYASLKALAVAVPDTLAIFASPHNDREIVFLSSFGLFDLWSTVLLAYGLVSFAKLRITTGLGIAFGLDIVIALLFGF
ncbi:MAG: hypothetical protein M3R44_03170 [Candidatus Eremiobacteraeota bacterium]|nr:hypothetical protein [Candidatus Eremiobacteraeota bacterium]